MGDSFKNSCWFSDKAKWVTCTLCFLRPREKGCGLCESKGKNCLRKHSLLSRYKMVCCFLFLVGKSISWQEQKTCDLFSFLLGFSVASDFFLVCLLFHQYPCHHCETGTRAFCTQLMVGLYVFTSTLGSVWVVLFFNAKSLATFQYHCCAYIWADSSCLRSSETYCLMLYFINTIMNLGVGMSNISRIQKPKDIT